jgi:hypothetical protein
MAVPYAMGVTPLHEAASKGDAAAVRSVLAEHPEQLEAGTQGFLETPLHRAAVGGHAGAAEALLAAGADINAQRSGGFTPLHLAENMAVAEVLLKKGADTTVRSASGKTAGECCNGGPEVQRLIASYDSTAPTPAPAPTEAAGQGGPELTAAVRAFKEANPDLGLKQFVAKFKEHHAGLQVGTKELKEVLAGILAPLPPSVEANATDSAAEEAKAEGNAAVKRKDYRAAAARYSEAIALDPSQAGLDEGARSFGTAVRCSYSDSPYKRERGGGGGNYRMPAS